MPTWDDLTKHERSELVITALGKNRQRRVNAYAWDRGTKRYPYIHLRELGLLAEIRRGKFYVTYKLCDTAIPLLLAAPDDYKAGLFPLPQDITEMKAILRGVTTHAD